MKRFISLILCVLICFSLFCACSKVETGDSSMPNENELKQSTITDVEDIVIMSSDRVMSNYFDISLFDEENYSDIYLAKSFKLNAKFLNTTFNLPLTIEKMEALGWVLAEGNTYDANSLVFSYETIDATFENQDGVKIKAQFHNSSRSSVKLSKCKIVKIFLTNNFYVDNAQYHSFNVNGITNTMAITDIINVLGTPSHFYKVSDECYYLDYFTTKKDRRNGITVYINPVEDNIISIEFSQYK